MAKTIVDRTWKSQNGFTREIISVRDCVGTPSVTLRFRMHLDSYPQQSWGTVEVWVANQSQVGWEEIYRIPGPEMCCVGNAKPRKVDPSVFVGDLVELDRVASEILGLKQGTEEA
jgi:hypothetical protein